MIVKMFSLPLQQLNPFSGLSYCGSPGLQHPLHKNHLKEIKAAGDLKKVIRDYSLSAGFDREIEFQEPDSVSVE